ncbi:MAG: OmpH family outer membrane protein [Chitinophagaceae bacterium]|nr:OmpH family outer membrane protein [Chitinophagaceae bacterium]
MKNFLLAFNILLLVLTGVLFYLYFSHQDKVNKISSAVSQHNSDSARALKIAYVDLDSIQEHYDYYKEKTGEFEKEKETLDRSLNNAYQKIENERIAFLQKGNSITQIEAENFQREYTRKMEDLKNQQRNMENQIQEKGIKTMEDLKKRINEFLNEYNKTKGYSYIFSYSSSINVLFYKDTAYNISREVIAGLNETYRKAKVKK